ncbi:HAD family hydrolase [Nanoarchaeota archaeon]
MIKAIIFDLDDTLYLERDFVYSGFNAVANHIHSTLNIPIEGILDSLKKGFDDGIRNKNFNELIDKKNLQIDVNELVSIYRDHTPEISLCEDSALMLPNLKNKFKIGLLTDGYPETQQNKIDALGVSNFFNSILINDLSKNENKVDNNSFEIILALLNVKGNETIAIGDNPKKDFEIPHSLGIRTIRINRPNSLHNDVPEYPHTDFAIENLSTLTKIIQEIEND